MGNYTVRIAPAADRAFEKLPLSAQEEVAVCIESLSENPRPIGVEKLCHDICLWRVQVGRYLVIYSIDESAPVVMVLRVRHCMDVYRGLDKTDLAVVARNVGPLLHGLPPESKNPA